MIIKKRKLPILICLLITYCVVQAKGNRMLYTNNAFQLPAAETSQNSGDNAPKDKEEDEDWSTIRYYFFVRSVPTPTVLDQQLNVLAKYGELVL